MTLPITRYFTSYSGVRLPLNLVEDVVLGDLLGEQPLELGSPS